MFGQIDWANPTILLNYIMFSASTSVRSETQSITIK